MKKSTTSHQDKAHKQRRDHKPLQLPTPKIGLQEVPKWDPTVRKTN